MLPRSSILVILLTTCVLMCAGCNSHHHQRIAVPTLAPEPKPMPPVKVAVVLSAGGFRGVAHIGALEVLEENNIPVDLVVGSSSGSMIGAFYCANPDSQILKQKLMHANFETLIDTSWMHAVQAPFYPTGPVRGRALQRFMLDHLEAQDFEDLKIPLVVVATSLINNKKEIIRSGPIIPAVHSSVALPPYFAPVRIYQNYFTDGGVSSPVPVEVAKLFRPKLTIAVDISRKPSLSELRNAFQITGRAMDISFYELAQRQVREADIVIRPDIAGFGPFEDDYNEEFYIAGRRAAELKINEIKRAFLKIK